MFRTEGGYDLLTMNDRRYSGANSPLEENVTAGGIIRWSSDGSVTDSGFRICGAGELSHTN